MRASNPPACSGGERQGFGNAYVCRGLKRRRMSPLLLNWAPGLRRACTEPARYPVRAGYMSRCGCMSRAGQTR